MKKETKIWIGVCAALLIAAAICALVVLRARNLGEMLSLPRAESISAASVLDPEMNAVPVYGARVLREIHAATEAVRVRFSGWAATISPTEQLYTVYLSADETGRIPVFSIRGDGMLFLDGKQYRVLDDSGAELLRLLESAGR
jgi:hypothetical protein